MAGEIIAGRYELLEPLDSGGFATVYRTVDGVHGRVVALKLLRARFRDNPAVVRQFRKEIELAGRLARELDHPNIVRVLDGRADGDVPFLVMELVDGQTLEMIVQQRGPLPVAEVLVLGRQLLQALHAAHGRGVIHRDVKPANVMLGADGQLKILDFGIARRPIDRGKDGSLDAGTAAYMAPEQIRHGHVDHRADLYAAACTLFELLTGVPPFLGEDDDATIALHLNAPPPRLRARRPDAPPALEAVIIRALDKYPQRRFSSAHDMRLALPAVKSGGTGPIRTSTAQHKKQTTGQRPRSKTDRQKQHTGAVSADLDQLFRAGQAALARGDWPRAVANLSALVHRQPGYSRDGQSARELLAIARQHGGARPWATAPVLAAVVAVLMLMLVILAAGSGPSTASRSPATQSAATASRPPATQSAASVVAATGQPTTSLSVPLSGRLDHQETSLVKIRLYDDVVRDFEARVQFLNPYAASARPWDYGFMFRHTGPNSEYRLVIESTARWTLDLVDDVSGQPRSRTISGGNLRDLNVAAGGRNDLRLVVADGEGVFYVNDRFISTIDVTAKRTPGLVGVGTNFLPGRAWNGMATDYDAFTVSAIR